MLCLAIVLADFFNPTIIVTVPIAPYDRWKTNAKLVAARATFDDSAEVRSVIVSGCHVIPM